MTDLEINMAIAEACGWVPRIDEWMVYSNNEKALCISGTQKECLDWADSLPRYSKYRNGDWEIVPHYSNPPNYCSDLNAMCKVVDDIISSLWEKYLNNIVLVTKTEFDKSLCSQMRRHNATARQRAEAFLKTLNKWIE